MTDTVLIKREGRVATVLLNRPDKHNAINAVMRSAFAAAIRDLSEEPAVSVLVIRGEGGKAFSSGADLKEIADRSPMARRAMTSEEPALVVRGCPKPVIAAIEGFAFGGGLEIAMACDIRLAAENAVFCFPEITRGWFPAAGGTQALPRLVGMGKAMELILSGRRFDASEAENMGLLNAVYPQTQFDAAVKELAERIGAHNPDALMLAKAAMNMSARTSVDVGLAYERELGALSYTLEGRAEALAAFAAGRAKA